MYYYFMKEVTPSAKAGINGECTEASSADSTMAIVAPVYGVAEVKVYQSV